MPRSGWQLLREGFPERPELGPALSRLLLDQVAAGLRPATVRLSRPGRVVAFGRRDVVSPGYVMAVAAAARAGFPGMERISGGRAAAFSEGALSLTLTIPDNQPAKRTRQRFEEWSGLIRDSLIDLGIDARIGPVPGEYCPGEYSVNAEGKIKLAGVGQRMVRGAAHIGFVILVTGAELISGTLAPVYRELGLEFRPESVGSLEQAVPGLDLAGVEAALLARLRAAVNPEETALDPATLDQARSVAGRFRSDP